MKTNHATKVRSRAEILAEIASLPASMQGKICEDKRTLANGKTAVYHNLQYWENGKNHTIRIPADKLAEFRKAVKTGVKARALLFELTRTDAETILSTESPLKKSSRRSSSGEPRASTNL